MTDAEIRGAIELACERAIEGLIEIMGDEDMQEKGMSACEHGKWCTLCTIGGNSLLALQSMGLKMVPRMAITTVIQAAMLRAVADTIATLSKEQTVELLRSTIAELKIGMAKDEFNLQQFNGVM